MGSGHLDTSISATCSITFHESIVRYQIMERPKSYAISRYVKTVILRDLTPRPDSEMKNPSLEKERGLGGGDLVHDQFSTLFFLNN